MMHEPFTTCELDVMAGVFSYLERHHENLEAIFEYLYGEDESAKIDAFGELQGIRDKIAHLRNQ